MAKYLADVIIVIGFIVFDIRHSNVYYDYWKTLCGQNKKIKQTKILEAFWISGIEVIFSVRLGFEYFWVRLWECVSCKVTRNLPHAVPSWTISRRSFVLGPGLWNLVSYEIAIC